MSEVRSGSFRAIPIIDKYIRKGIAVVKHWEEIYHDGYDELGATSNIFDLYIVYEKDGKKFRDNWHAEEWYKKDEDTNYKFSYTQEEK